jgi:hypothetical protein
VIDGERAPERLARLASIPGQERGLETRVEQVLDGGSRARSHAVLHADEADEASCQGHEQDRLPHRFELLDATLGDPDAHVLVQKERATPDHQSLTGG